jgi:hypothetical protein
VPDKRGLFGGIVVVAMCARYGARGPAGCALWLRAARRALLMSSGAAVCAFGLLAGCTSHSAKADSPVVSAGSSSVAPAGSLTGTATSTLGPKSSAKPVPSASATSSGSLTGGSITQTVPSRSIEVKAPVPLTSAASFDNSVKATIDSVRSMVATAQGPGEISGPAVAVTITVNNGSAKAIDLNNVVVNLLDKAGTPSVPMTASPAKALDGTLAAGKKASGIYVFSLPRSHRNPITISLSYTADAPVVRFVGDAQ